MAPRSKRRSKFLETKYFAFIIGLIVVCLFFALSRTTTIFQGLERKVLDAHLMLKTIFEPKHIQEGVTYTEPNLKKSDDISIVGIDLTTLSDYGKYPFPRYHFADLINAYSRIKDQNLRESALFVDVFFVDMDSNAADDALLAEAMASSKRVVLETVLRQDFSASMDEAEYWKRFERLEAKMPSISKVSGPWQSMYDNKGFEAPLAPFAQNVLTHGHANYIEDPDGIYRSQALIGKISRLVETVPLEDLTVDYRVERAKYERICWMDKIGEYHDIAYPLTQKTIDSLKKELPLKSPPKIDDTDGDGQPDAESFVIRKYKDYFTPAVTLALALNYFHKTTADIEVVIGKHIRIPSPQYWDAQNGAWIPYSIQVERDEFNEKGELVKAGKRKVLPEIVIPIDKNGQMIINYMGSRSSESGEGLQTFPVRSFSVLANMVKPADPELWRNSMASANKIIMVGAFSRGMAQDEKPTPMKLMYGIEMHANALNTILMDNFIHEMPIWSNLAILCAFVLLVCFMSSRLPSVLSFGITLVLIVSFFFGISIWFEKTGNILDFAAPALAVIFSFVSIIVYRAMTEEKDKKMLRATFGKYVSPRVVDQLVANPPELGGVDKDITVFFSDIRGFSTLSENMSPQELVNHLNVYLAAMTDLILEYGGTLDKYIGDAIMAFWGAPLPQADHARRACECSLKQMAKLKELNLSWPPEKRINIGIGINSGIMTVGNMGSSIRMNYTLMGDNVNLGSRLEGTNKEYGTNIIISEQTYGLIKDDFIVRELDNVRVKGKNKPVGIYELVDAINPIEMKDLK
jgi:adenylate cyclase